MTKPATVFFTGMDTFDAEQLAVLFHEINRRTGSRWTLGSDAESASVLVIDVDTLYGHMTWLHAQNSGQIVVALTTGEHADADHVLHRPVTPDAMRRLLLGLSKDSGPDADMNAAAAPTPTPAPAPAPTPATTDTLEEPARIATPVAAAVTSPPVQRETPAPAPVAAPASPATFEDSAPTTAASPYLIDVLLADEPPQGAQKFELVGHGTLAFDRSRKVFAAGSGIREYLPYTQVALENGAIRTIGEAEFDALCQSTGGTQPLARLLWLAALGGNAGKAPVGGPNARFRLRKWPQIEREFPKHFRIATAMMKGFHSPTEFAEQSGASVPEVNDFIAASLTTGHAEAEAPVPTETAPAPTQKRLFDRLRGGR